MTATSTARPVDKDTFGPWSEIIDSPTQQLLLAMPVCSGFSSSHSAVVEFGVGYVGHEVVSATCVLSDTSRLMFPVLIGPANRFAFRVASAPNIDVHVEFELLNSDALKR